VNLKLGKLVVPMRALVSDHVSEGMLGYDWLAENDYYWGFKNGQVKIRNQEFKLRTRMSTNNCCRVTVQEDVVIPRQSETVIPTKILFDTIGESLYSGRDVEFATIPSEIRGGLYVARTMVPHQCAGVPLRILNCTCKAVHLKKGNRLTD
jgi:hypothetical protein